MNCQMCKYREQVLGFEAEIGLPQESHHHHVEGIGGGLENCPCNGDCDASCRDEEFCKKHGLPWTPLHTHDHHDHDHDHGHDHDQTMTTIMTTIIRMGIPTGINMTIITIPIPRRIIRLVPIDEEEICMAARLYSRSG